MMGENGVRQIFEEASKGADIAVIEGVMGLYDGLEATDEGSSAHVAKFLTALFSSLSMSKGCHAVPMPSCRDTGPLILPSALPACSSTGWEAPGTGT